MKVVCNATIEKCASVTNNNLNDYENAAVELMNKLNEKFGRDSTTNDEKNAISQNGSINDDGDDDDAKTADEKKSSHSKTTTTTECVNTNTNDEKDADIWTKNANDSTTKDDHRNTSCPGTDSGLESAASSWDKSVTEVKEHAFTKLEEELQQAREILKLRDEEVIGLRKIRQDVENELLELTASLFQEAHRMVREANSKQVAAEKALHESRMQVEVLTGEVEALKTLVLTSTPSKPNLHLHAQTKEDSFISNGGNFFKKHNRSPSHFDLKYGRNETSSCDSSLENINQVSQNESPEMKDENEIDPNVFRDFLSWRENPTLEKDNCFITHMYREDIDQCLDFNNSTLVNEVKKAIDSDSIFIEAVDKTKSHFPKRCALMEIPRSCFYRMKITDSDEWHYISQMCRNRIIAVCNFLNYLRYIQRGLVKSPAEDMYWEIVRLRKEMVHAKLGLPISSHSC